MKHVKLAVIGVLVALTVLAVGFLWGARGRWAAEERLATVERQWRLANARREALAGTVDIYKLNFGAATGHFEAARAEATTVAASLESAGLGSQAQGARAAASHLDEARALAAKLDQTAGQRAAAAAGELDRVDAAIR
jgi:hypothetical protein